MAGGIISRCSTTTTSSSACRFCRRDSSALLACRVVGRHRTGRASPAFRKNSHHAAGCDRVVSFWKMHMSEATTIIHLPADVRDRCNGQLDDATIVAWAEFDLDENNRYARQFVVLTESDL